MCHGFFLQVRQRWVEHSARRKSEIHKKRRKYLALLRSRQEEAAIEEEGGVSYASELNKDLED